MKKLFTYLSVFIIMMMIPIGVNAQGYYLVGDLNSFARAYNDVSWDGGNWDSNGAINKVLKFKDNGNGTYSLRIPASYPADDSNQWDKPNYEKGNVSHEFVIAPESAFSGTEYTGDLSTVGNDNAWKTVWGLSLNWNAVLRPTSNNTISGATSGGLSTGGSTNWKATMNGGSYTITINPSANTWSVTNDQYTHVMYVISKQDGKWRASDLTDVTTGSDQAYNHRHGDNASRGELSEFPNNDGATVYIAHNWYERGNNKNFSTKEHLTIFGAWNTNGDLAPVTWLYSYGTVAKSIFPKAGVYSTNIDPTTGRTDGVGGGTNSQKIITNGNDPSTGNITGKKGDEALITPDATLSPGTTTWANYTLNQAKALTVTMSNCTAWQYSIGTGTTPSINGSGTSFGNLSYDGTDVKLGSTVIASGTNTVTICIRGMEGTSTGTTHEYTYTFTQATPLVINPAGGFYINKKNVNFSGGTAPYYYTVDGTDPASSATRKSTNDNTIDLSTAGTLRVLDSGGKTASADFDFTYSTSDNYVSYMSNTKTLDVVGPTLFVYKNGSSSLPYFKAVDKNNSNAVIVNWTQMPSTNTKTDGNGNTWYYYTFDAQYTNIGINFATSSSGTNSTSQITMTADKYFAYDYNSSYSNSSNKGVYYDMTNVSANSTDVFYIDTENWSTAYIWSWPSGGNGSVSSMSSTSTVYLGTGSTKTVYRGTPNNTSYKLLFKKESGSTVSTKTCDLTYSGSMLYQHWGDSGDVLGKGRVFNLPQGTHSFTMSTGTYTYNKPNGEDYYTNMPSDYTWKLLPDSWIFLSGNHSTESGQNWKGDEASYYYIDGCTMSQTIDGLDPTKNYTVQAIVRGNDSPLSLKLNNSTTVTKTINSWNSNPKSPINKFGRYELNVEEEIASGCTGWDKLEATAKPNSSGQLTITIDATNSACANVSDVVVLEEANTLGHYWTKAPTSESVTEYDMSGRSNYNAFSFFDRGDNLNAIIKAHPKTVIGMSAANEPYYESNRRHPANVVVFNGSTWTTPQLALTDYGTNTVSPHAYRTSFDFVADKFYYDRAISVKMMSTILPFPITNAQLKSVLGSGVKIYTLSNLDATNLKVTFGETSADMAASTPFFFKPSITNSNGITLNSTINVSATSNPAPAQGLIGCYRQTYNVGSYYKGQNFVPYFYQNNKFVYAEDAARAKPFRVVFLLSKGSGNARSLSTEFIDDSIVTGIKEINTVGDANAPIYSIDGKMVSKDGNAANLHRGVYIQNGNKFVVK